MLSLLNLVVRSQNAGMRVKVFLHQGESLITRAQKLRGGVSGQPRMDAPVRIDADIGTSNKGLHYRFFDVMVDPVSRRDLSEDFGFCRLWSALGESIYVDANSISRTRVKLYQGDFANSLLASLPFAVGAPTGTAMRLIGSEYLAPGVPPG